MWLLERIRETVENHIPFDGNRLSPCEDITAKASLSNKLPSNVLTPDKIPDFFIPPKLSKDSGNSKRLPAKYKINPSASENNIQHCTKMPLLHVRSGSFIKSNERRDLVKLANQHIIQIESVEDVNEDNKMNIHRNKLGDHAPCPQGATYYGLSGFFESPNTRRKESLFHVDLTSYTLRKQGSFPSKQLLSPTGSPSLLNSSDISLPPCHPCKVLSKQGILDSDTQSSNESSPYSSPLLPRSLSGSSLLKIFGQESSLGESSRSTSKQSLGGSSSFSTDECSSADTSPSASKKSFFTVSALGCSLAPPVLFSLDLLQCQERLQKEHLIQLHGRGMVRLSAEYDPGSATLRVRVVSVEDLYDSSFEVKCVNCCVIVCLTPGKMQRQQSTIIKNSRNPIFNEDFFFDEVTEEDLQSMSLKLKVLNKASSLKRDTVLGVNAMPLFQLLPL
ncbi:C2 calcium-dependent domain-containing protein 4C [Acipenser ruthenus]|uniref:C2 calcium-dependent domain-containing protein 4C n=1 Tax=Acipenser ruthenus TaxID=7906 RepID=A0A444UDT0_ACIRT|nr:C2 calcium-dependent domain-containing protein 4C-like [Acipenser ruthenus]RXM33332.1 C2 calcium-dependent domain-containing protein 4C [Acipenser ruthenus]